MRILLLGDFSSFHKYLKKGLEELGHEVVLASLGDGWKKITGSDAVLYEKAEDSNRLVANYNEKKSAYKIAEMFQGFDVVQLMHPLVYPWRFGGRLIKKIARRNKCLSLVSAGGDLALSNAYNAGKLTQYMYDYNPQSLNRYSEKSFSGRCSRKVEEKIVDLCDVIIPAAYEYGLGYAENKRRAKVIPMPVNVGEIEYHPNVVKGAVVIFHGISRPNSKGTPFIKEALDIIKQKYGAQVKIIMVERLPFEEYTQVMNQTNVVIDQCCSYVYGINADIALAKGKIVLSGARREALEAYGVKECPIFGILPDVQQIVDTLSYIIDNKDRITEWGEQSRQYVEELHDCKKVAVQYIEAWKATGKI